MTLHRDTQDHLYALALGSNRAISAALTPKSILRRAIMAISVDAELLASAPVIQSAPIGPSQRQFANTAIIVRSDRSPHAMLRLVQMIEHRFGRKRHRKWGARTLDIDIILWSHGRWRTSDLTIPHPLFSSRSFVTTPLLAIAPQWRDPISQRTIAQIHHRLNKARKSTISRG